VRDVPEALEQRLRLGALFDLYGMALTERQRQVCERVLNEDASLGEIGEGLGTTRQAVHDLLARSRQRLEEWEGRLGLLEREGAEGRVRRAVRLLVDRWASRLPEPFLGEIRSLLGEARGSISASSGDVPRSLLNPSGDGREDSVDV